MFIGCFKGMGVYLPVVWVLGVPFCRMSGPAKSLLGEVGRHGVGASKGKSLSFWAEIDVFQKCLGGFRTCLEHVYRMF